MNLTAIHIIIPLTDDDDVMFQDCKSLPAPVQFTGEQPPEPEEFMAYKAKWHKSCHLKFTPSKLKILLGKKRNLESGQTEGGPRKSKRMSMGIAKQDSCMFFTKITGTLHARATMKLDNDLRLMATELQDAELLARISCGDLISIEASTIIIVYLRIKANIGECKELDIMPAPTRST